MIKFKHTFFILFIWLISSDFYAQTITTATLLDELISMERLIEISDPSYKILHFTSYDRRSKGKSPDEEGWFLNSDGFGKEPIPNFEMIIEEPDQNGIGKYLICDVEGPGAIIRTWTAKITGDIAVYLDNNIEPLYKGPAEPFLIHTYDAILFNEEQIYGSTLTQFFSGYYPVPFATRCRIEWIGDINNAHFYYVQIRQYKSDTPIQTFSVNDMENDSERICKIKNVLSDPNQNIPVKSETQVTINSFIKEGESTRIFELEGTKAIERLKIKISAEDLSKALRQNILRIYFDDRHWGQVQAPVGDFFCSAPGINPANSLPFTVTPDGYLTCRFVMPFKESCQIFIDNYSDQDCEVEGEINYCTYEWKDSISMYFNAKWRIDNNITATNNPPKDLMFIMVNGRGRYVGTGVFLMNPAEAPSRHGSWWGEGDEKVYIDNVDFPTVFGTGSEDYFGYAWAAEHLFNYAFIGQPRNDGPGNRGFVVNYRYHIIDDFPFNKNLHFMMELFHQDSIPGFSYGRIVYYYSLPGSYDDHQVISHDDVRMLKMPETFHLKAFKGSRNFIFHEAESIVVNKKNISIEKGPLWSENTLMVWKPERKGEKLTFNIPLHKEGNKMRIMLTLRGSPLEGKFSVLLNNSIIKENVDMNESYHTLSKNIQLDDIDIQDQNELVLVFEGEKDQQLGIDFIWVRIE